MVKYYSPQVEPLKNGKFKYSIRYTDPSFVGVRKKSVTIAKDTTHARNLANTKVKQMIREKLNIQSIKPITMDKLIDKLKNNLDKQGLAIKTRNSYFSTLDIISKDFKDKLVASVNTTELNVYLNDLLYERKLSNGTIKIYLLQLRKIFEYAIQFGYIKKDPTLKIKINYKNERAKKQSRVENWYLTDDELNTVLTYCLHKKREDYYHLFKWLYLTGMRVGEATALLINNVFQDPKTKLWYATISGTLVHVKGKGEVRQEFTKTASSYRTIALPDEAVEIYKECSKDRNKNDYLFRNKFYGSQLSNLNNPFSVSTISHFLRVFVDKNKWKKQITSHIFRHTHVSKLAEEGYPLSLITDRVGHSSSEITRKIYLHITKKEHLEFDKSMQNFK